MLRIVVLHKPTPSRIYITDERDQVFVKYTCIHSGIHNAFKNAYSSGSATTYPCPNVDFHWAFRTRFVTGLLAPLVAVKTTMVLPNKGRPLRAVVLETETPLLFIVETSSLAVVSSSLCIEFSIDPNTQRVSLFGRPHFSGDSILLCSSKCCLNRQTVCLQVIIPSDFRVLTYYICNGNSTFEKSLDSLSCIHRHTGTRTHCCDVCTFVVAACTARSHCNSTDLYPVVEVEF